MGGGRLEVGCGKCLQSNIFVVILVRLYGYFRYLLLLLYCFFSFVKLQPFPGTELLLEQEQEQQSSGFHLKGGNTTSPHLTDTQAGRQVISYHLSLGGGHRFNVGDLRMIHSIFKITLKTLNSMP